ncbi:MAG: NAD(P)H-hydrate dehydratase [Planctomycetota bacterium]
MVVRSVIRKLPGLPKRADDSHKGDVGRIMVVGGCQGPVTMIGAPALAANAAVRSGAGLVQIMAPEGILLSLGVLAPVATLRRLPPDGASLLEAVSTFGTDVLAIGPGLGASIERSTLLQILTEFKGPIVVDADGLNLLASGTRVDISDPGRIVLTPHPGEMARLLSSWGCQEKFGRTTAERRAAAIALVDASGCTVVLKGTGTVVADTHRVYINETGNSGMATGGSGDVLTGVIAAFLGQGMAHFDASMLGVYLHGSAGDLAAEDLGRHGVTALDLIDFLPDSFCEYDTDHGE